MGWWIFVDFYCLHICQGFNIVKGPAGSVQDVLSENEENFGFTNYIKEFDINVKLKKGYCVS